MVSYHCKEPDCDKSVAWHLVNGELDCLGDNREALAEFAATAQAAIQDVAELVVNVDAHGGPYEGKTVSIVLHPPGWEAPVEAPASAPSMEM